MTEPTLLLFSLSIAQAFVALLLALVFQGFFRIYRRAHLQFWSLSFWAGVAGFAGAAFTLLLAHQPDIPVSARTLLAALSLAAVYLQIVWLLAGAYVGATRHRLAPRRLQTLLLAAAALGMLSAVLFAGAPDGMGARMFLRVELRSFLTAAAFFIAGVFLWSGETERDSFGRRLLATAFVLYGMQQLAVLGAFVSQRLMDTAFGWMSALGLSNLVGQVLIGLALVIWLLEEERTRARNATRRLYHLSFHDALTGLPNRKLFLERLAHALEQEQNGARYVVAMVNIDRFRLLNESLGHQQADRLLAQLGDRLLHRAQRVDTVARIGGDEFALLFREDDNNAFALDACEQLLQRLREPFSMDDRDLLLTCSIGVSSFPEDGSQPETLLANASAATIRAREYGGDQLITFDIDMSGRAHEQLEFENDLRRAFERREFTLVYQPVLLADNNTVSGFEALLRWKHAKRGLLAPDEFLPLAESLGLMDRITDWVLESACRQVNEWRQRFDLPLWVAVNFSASAFRSPDLIDRVMRVLRAARLAPEDLLVEITENVAMENFETGVVTLEQLRLSGVRIALDDFGTGFSSLSYLRRLPIDKVKLDKEFIHEISQDMGSLAIVEALVPLAHKLGIRVVAEGVETEAQLAQLRDAGIDEIQGYLMYEPMPPATCQSMLESASAARYFRNEVI
ncbi:MAG TPA: bifunctional diguanylate cyclase/phosphodiesterase [Gammaproteobacteria bacterium]